jgi:hypothetical protein
MDALPVPGEIARLHLPLVASILIQGCRVP